MVIFHDFCIFQHIETVKRMTSIAVYRLRRQVKMVIRPIHVCQRRRNAMDIWIVERVAMKTVAPAPSVDWINSDVPTDKSVLITYENVTTNRTVTTTAMNRVVVSIIYLSFLSIFHMKNILSCLHAIFLKFNRMLNSENSIKSYHQ